MPGDGRSISQNIASLNMLVHDLIDLLYLETHNAFTEEINKIALSSNDDKRIQSTDSIETYAYWMRKVLVSKKEEIKCNNIKRWYKND